MYCILIPYPYKTSVIEGALNFIKERYIIGMESIMLLSVVVLLSFLKPYVLITDVIIIYIILEVLLIFVNIAMYKYLVFLNNTEDVVFVDSSIESPLKQLKVKVE